MGYSPWGCKDLDTTELSHTHLYVMAAAYICDIHNSSGSRNSSLPFTDGQLFLGLIFLHRYCKQPH